MKKVLWGLIFVLTVSTMTSMVSFGQEKGETKGIEEIIGEITNIIRSHPQDIAEFYKSLGQFYQRQGRLGEAIEVYKKALKIAPNDVNLRQSLAQLYNRQKMYEKAILEYKRLIELNPEIYKTLLCLEDET